SITIIAGLSAALSYAAEPMVYPAKGQSTDQQNHDQTYCKGWAQQQVQQSNTGNQATSTEGGVVKDRARRAVPGAAIGAAGGSAGKGAAAGAAAGGVGGGAKRRNAQEKQQEQVADAYNRAFSVCMEGKGYTVK